MKERKTVTKALAGQYRRASKKKKGEILNQVVEATDYNRSYASWVLRNHGRRVEVKPGVVLEGKAGGRPRKPRARRYGPPVAKALKQVWEILDYVCGKNLAAALSEVVPRLVKLGELKVSKEVEHKLLEISAATIDRLLKPERDRHTLKRRGATKPGSLLKHQVPIRTFADWNEGQPGFLEMDLVGHDGGSAQGEYCQTLDITDVATGWSEQVAVPTKAQKWVFQAVKALRNRLPFAVRGLDSDNGGEFINEQLVRYCDKHKISFTRSRPYRKNDTCYVEQKNWSIVRRYAGYGRYDTEQACRMLNELYVLLHDYVNFFLPSMKLKEKVRDGARVLRRYDTPQTPYRRVLESPDVDQDVKCRLRSHYETLNPAQLHRRIERLQKRLTQLAVRPVSSVEPREATPSRKRPADNHPWRRRWTWRQP